jgi:cytochrome c553
MAGAASGLVLARKIANGPLRYAKPPDPGIGRRQAIAASDRMEKCTLPVHHPGEFTRMRITQRPVVFRSWLPAVACAVAVLGINRTFATPSSDPLPDWAFVAIGPALDAAPKDEVTVPGSSLRLAAGGKDNADFYGTDWFPQDHAPMPDVVAHGRPPQLPACVECHLPSGVGGPESAVIAGLPAAYIEQQFEEFRTGRRTCAASRGTPCATAMARVSQQITAPELKAAAAYYASLEYRSRIRVVEAATVPRSAVSVWALVRDPRGGTEPIGQRILELPDDAARYFRGDWRATITAYVPPGSLARGKKSAEDGAGMAPCTSCHGPDLKGTPIAPPLAGRAPGYIVRQLYDIQHGYRTGPAVALMQPEVAHLTPQDRIDLGAWLASLPD